MTGKEQLAVLTYPSTAAVAASARALALCALHLQALLCLLSLALLQLVLSALCLPGGQAAGQQAVGQGTLEALLAVPLVGLLGLLTAALLWRLLP